MTPQEYRNRPALSGSALNALAQSPAHFQARLADRSESPAMRLGTAAHALILEGVPEFHRRYKVAGQCCAIKRDGADCENAATGISPDGRQLCGVHGKGLDLQTDGILSREDAEACAAMLSAVKEHPAARRLLFSAGESEVILVHREGEAAMKGMVDRLPASGSCIVDLKTTADIARWEPDGYALQVAHYIRLLNLQGGRQFDGAVFVVVETSAPYAVRVVMLDDAAISAASAKVEQLWELYASCIASGEWPKPILGEDGVEVASLKLWTLRGWA